MTRCALCPGSNNCLPVDGPSNADLLFIGEAPGFNENKHKKVFVGKTGEEVDQSYLPLAGLRRRQVQFTNAIRCFPISAGGKLDANRTKDQALLESCAAHHLYPLLERTPPRLIIPMGAFACRAVLPGCDLDLQHGIPAETPWGIPAFPMFHPALGLHEPKRMLQIRNDWIRLKSYLAGTLQLPVDAYPTPDYQEVTDEADLGTLDPLLPIALDTESRRDGSPFCLTYSQQPGGGRLILAERKDLVQQFGSLLATWRSPVLIHNALYDWAVAEAMELQLPIRYVVDTMARVFHLGNLPQGLKALAARELGMVMQDFEDVVAPYSRRRVLDYYEFASYFEWGKPDEELKIDDATGLWKLYKPQGMATKFKRFFTDYSKNPDKDVFGMWEKNWVSQQAAIEEKCGPWPGLCISHVPFEKTLFYACRDVDALIRLAPLLLKMRSNVRKRPQEEWRV